jgi:hypothetical protein
VPGSENGRKGEYLTDRLTEESIKFLEQNKNQPFLLFLSHYAVHTPIQSKQELMEKYRAKILANPFSKAEELKQMLRERQSKVNAQMPKPNPEYKGSINK